VSTYAHRVSNCSGEYLDGKYTDEIARLISLTLGDRVLSGSKGNSNSTHKGHCCAAHCVMRPSIEKMMAHTGRNTTFAAGDRWPALAAPATREQSNLPFHPVVGRQGRWGTNKKAQPALVAVATKPLRGRATLALGRRAGRGDGYGEMG
jgi:hypothetical protein